MLVKDFIKNFNKDCRIRVAVFDKNILADSLYINIDDIKAPITNYEIKSISQLKTWIKNYKDGQK